jgi:hypothetical protein
VTTLLDFRRPFKRDLRAQDLASIGLPRAQFDTMEEVFFTSSQLRSDHVDCLIPHRDFPSFAFATNHDLHAQLSARFQFIWDADGMYPAKLTLRVTKASKL